VTKVKLGYLDMNANSPNMRIDTFRTDARGVGRLMSYVGDIMQREDPGIKKRPIPYMPEKRPHAMKVGSMKQKPEDVGYDAMGGTAERRCGKCANFIEPNGCLLVEGAVESGGYCDLFEVDGSKTASIVRQGMMSKIAGILDGKTDRQISNLVRKWVKGEKRRNTYLAGLKGVRNPALMREYVRSIGNKHAPAELRSQINALGGEKHISRPADWVRDYESKLRNYKQGSAKPPSDPMYDKCWKGYKKVPGKKRGEKGSCEKAAFDFKKKHKNPEGGLSEAGRKAYNKATGGNLKRPQPEGGSRRDSFCARMKGMKKKLTSKETANDPDSRINKSLRKWNC
jgi:hypothetical protein